MMGLGGAFTELESEGVRFRLILSCAPAFIMYVEAPE